MKFLTIILSTYIFALNLVPCGGDAMLHNEVKTEVLQQMDHNGDHQHKNQDCDLCSPFCQCHCCHVHAVHFKTLDFSIASTEIDTKVFFHFNGLEEDFTTSILQPPRQ